MTEQPETIETLTHRVAELESRPATAFGTELVLQHVIARRITVVDDQGCPRITLECDTDDAAEIKVIHPFDPDTVAILSAGIDLANR